MIQTLPNYQLPQPSYNAVKIDIHNPSVGGATCPIPQAVPNNIQQQIPNYYYTYPQTQLYDYQNAAQQPYYMPVNQTYVAPQQIPSTQPLVQPVAQAVQQACPSCNNVPVVPSPAPQQVNINQAPVTEQPVAVNDTKNAEQPKVEVAEANAVLPKVDVNAFLARLTNPDYEVQANAMEEIANLVKENPQNVTELLDSKIVDALVDITKADSSQLPGPTQEQIAVREKMLNGQEISEQDKKLATTITPMEQAERNKSYAMFTTAILQKLYGDEVLKLTGNREQLIALPGAVAIVDQLKDNPNPLVRTSAIDALSYIQTPEYKKDLTTLFTIAKNDVDQGVQDAATAALEKLNQV